jgi:hypothetical protein
VTANIRGTIEFVTPAGGQISALRIRYTPGPTAGGTTTTIPVLANVSTAGGLMAHLAVGTGWETTFVLVNTGVAAAQAHLKFFDKNGNPLPLPLSFPQAGGGPSIVAATLDRAIPAGASVWVRVTAPAGAAYEEGSAQLATDGNIGGFACKVVASIHTLCPSASPCLRRIFNTHCMTARCVSTEYSRLVRDTVE